MLISETVILGSFDLDNKICNITNLDTVFKRGDNLEWEQCNARRIFVLYKAKYST